MEEAKRIFVNSMSTCSRETAMGVIDRVFDVMRKADWHIYQILTSARGCSLFQPVEHAGLDGQATSSCMVGSSVEDSMGRVQIIFCGNPCDIRFLSVEPLIGRLARSA